MDLLRMSLQHFHEGGPFNLVHSVRMEEQKGFKLADLFEGGNIYKVICYLILYLNQMKGTPSDSFSPKFKIL